ILPSEAQWERVARHTDGREFPWGNGAEAAERCNMIETGIGRTCAVGMFPGGDAACGAADMAGNIWEWCRTGWQDDPLTHRGQEHEPLDGSDSRVLRGGSSTSTPTTCAARTATAASRTTASTTTAFGWRRPHFAFEPLDSESLISGRDFFLRRLAPRTRLRLSLFRPPVSGQAAS